MKNIAPKLLLVMAVATAIGIGFFKTNAQIAESKPQNSVPPTEQPSKLAEKIEGFNVVRNSGQIYAPRDLEEMVNKADLVVIGKPSQGIAESTTIIKRDSAGYLNSAVSQTKFKVSRVLKGKLDSENILVGQQAAIVKEKDDASYTMLLLEDYQPLVKNAKYILFLKKGLDGKPWYFPLGVYFGKINLDGKDQAEQKTDFAPEVRAIHAAARIRYRVEVDQPD
jgi:hypothetical protein